MCNILDIFNKFPIKDDYIIINNYLRSLSDKEYRSGRSPSGGNGNPRQYSCLENPMTEESGGLKFMESQRVRHN